MSLMVEQNARMVRYFSATRLRYQFTAFHGWQWACAYLRRS
eukprot:SAG22_NODE_17531_length_303_cov_0.759804_1_plen_40_part_01